MDACDIIVIGSGPAGQRAAIQAAKVGKRVALVERREVIGGTCINTGTIPSKTMREAVLHLSGFQFQGIYGVSYRVKERITMADLSFRVLFDRSVLEMFANAGETTITERVYPTHPFDRLELLPGGRAARASARVWPLRSTWPRP